MCTSKLQVCSLAPSTARAQDSDSPSIKLKSSPCAHHHIIPPEAKQDPPNRFLSALIYILEKQKVKVEACSPLNFKLNFSFPVPPISLPHLEFGVTQGQKWTRINKGCAARGGDQGCFGEQGEACIDTCKVRNGRVREVPRTWQSQLEAHTWWGICRGCPAEISRGDLLPRSCRCTLT